METNLNKTFTGGLRLEGIKATWPFGKLTVSKETIQIEYTGPVKSLVKKLTGGNLILQRNDIKQIRKYTLVPIIEWDVKISLNDGNKLPIYFWMMNRKSLLNTLREFDWID